MKTFPILLIGLFCLNSSLHAQSSTNAGVASATNSPTIDILMHQYQPLAAYFLDKLRYDGLNEIKYSDSDTKKISDLQSLSNQLVAVPGSEATVLNLLKSYQDHDALTRQTLFIALVHRVYTVADLPYLKQIFLESLECKQLVRPMRDQSWGSPAMFRSRLATRINRLTHPSAGPLQQDSVTFLNTKPIEWINQQVP